MKTHDFQNISPCRFGCCSAGTTSTGNRTHLGYRSGIKRRKRRRKLLLLLLFFFFFFSFFRFWQARPSKCALLPPQVTNRRFDSSQISRDRFFYATRHIVEFNLARCRRTSVNYHGKCEITGKHNEQAWTPGEDAAGISGRQYFFHRDMAAGTTLTSLCSALRLYRQTETADRGVAVKEEGLQSLLTELSTEKAGLCTPDVTCWLSVPIHLVYRAS